MHQGAGAGLGAQPLLLPGDDPGEGREPDRALPRQRHPPRMEEPPRRSRRHRAGGGRHRALARAHRRARPRPRLRHLAQGFAAWHPLRGRSLCALRRREDLVGGDRVIAHRAFLADNHRRTPRRYAQELRLRHRRDAGVFLGTAAAGATRLRVRPGLRQTQRQDAGAAELRCRRRSNSNATCCGRCSTRCITPMSSPSTSRREPSFRRIEADAGLRSLTTCARKSGGFRPRIRPRKS